MTTLDLALGGHSGVMSQIKQEYRMTDVGELAVGSSSTSQGGIATTQCILAIPRT